MQNITPFLWFNGQAEEAMNFYTSVFKDSKVINVSRYGEGAPAPKGTVMSATFELNGQKFMALNGGPHHSFTPAISFFVECETQEEVDELWNKLSEGGSDEQCGWLKDKFGLSWQVVPRALSEMITDPDIEKTDRVMKVLMQMKKLDLAALLAAYQGSGAGSVKNKPVMTV